MQKKNIKWRNSLLGQTLTKVTSTWGWVNGLKFLRHFHVWLFNFTQKVFTGIQHEKLQPITCPLMDRNRFKLTNKENRILKNKTE